jgi:formylmethanofuran dehydrogenase subunit E-like metal-binding protein
MEHQAKQPHNAMEVPIDCGYTEHTFDAKLLAAVDKLAEQYGPLGVALAAAVRTEPETLTAHVAAMFDHQRELWSWLRCDRFHVEQESTHGNSQIWYVIDGTAEPQDTIVATISMGDAEDAARALAGHLNHKITLARVAQAVADTSNSGRSE